MRADYKRMKKTFAVISIVFALALSHSAFTGKEIIPSDGSIVNGDGTAVFAEYGQECKDLCDVFRYKKKDTNNLPCNREQEESSEYKEGDVKKSAALISSYTTTFNRNVTARSYNIALACKNFCYFRVASGEELSFNKVVGRRTVENGYKEAKVIENGEYVPGVGGGVCQVSTTLYNAWITAGLGVVSVRAHSLPSSYCPMSRDATVSDLIDLVLVNDSGEDVIINATVTGNRVRFDIYGKVGTYTYKYETRLVKKTPPPEPVIEYVDHIEGGLESRQISAAKNGYITELTMHVYEGDREIERRVVRRDVYRGVAAKVQVKNSYD